MKNTLSVFKEQQEKTQTSLKELQHFIQKGEKFGLEVDKYLLEKLDVAVQTISEEKLKVALIGGFSEGKTTIASAWLERLDQNMNISQQESSNMVCRYNIDDTIELIDTPGLFGFKEQNNNDGMLEKYKETTKKYVSEAHLVLYVMNSANPVKESHQIDLFWLFRELNLLSRTVFVLSRFDEVADIEDDEDYYENLNIKKSNVIERLKSLIYLTDIEEKSIKIVGVSANPFGEGVDYWLRNPSEYKKISRIETLQEATYDSIEKNGGSASILLEAQLSIVKDILGRQLPIINENQHKLDEEILFLKDTVETLSEELKSLEDRMIYAKKSLNRFIQSYFEDLIVQAQGTSLENFEEFYDREIGYSGKIINQRLENEFRKQCESVSISLQRIESDFSHEVSSFRAFMGSELLNTGLLFLRNNKLTNNHLLTARDGIVSAAKWIGVDLSKYLKFAPWGAVNLANRINMFVAVAHAIKPIIDQYQKYEEEKKFRDLVLEISNNLVEQKEGLLQSMQDKSFLENLFPKYILMKNNFEAILDASKNMELRREEFEEWKKEGEMIADKFKGIYI